MSRSLSSLRQLVRGNTQYLRTVGSLFRASGIVRNDSAFSSSARAQKQARIPRLQPPEETDIEESFVKGSGPGGQKINKTNSAVQLKHLPTGLVVKCQETRSREHNRDRARQLLARKLDEIQNGPDGVLATVARRNSNKKASAAKKKRRKYRQLAEDGVEAKAQGHAIEEGPIVEEADSDSQPSPRADGALARRDISELDQSGAEIHNRAK